MEAQQLLLFAASEFEMTVKARLIEKGAEECCFVRRLFATLWAAARLSGLKGTLVWLASELAAVWLQTWYQDWTFGTTAQSSQLFAFVDYEMRRVLS